MDISAFAVPTEKLRWRLDPATLPFETTSDLAPSTEIVGQDRAVEAFRFGMGINKPGYNVIVTGWPGSGRLDVVKKLLGEIHNDTKPPEDFCYVNNFSDPEAPILLRFPAGHGRAFKKDVHDFIETLKREVPRVFESQEYMKRKNEIMEEYERKTREFFLGLDKRVKEAGFALVTVQAGQMERPELMPLVDGEPTPLIKLEELVDKGRFPREEYEEIRKKHTNLKAEIDQIFAGIREMQKELQEKGQEVDKITFTSMADDHMAPLFEKYPDEKVVRYLKTVLQSLSDNLAVFRPQQPGPAGLPFMLLGDPFLAYEVNLLIDNAEQKRPPIIVESYPTYRNLFGSIERVVDNRGVWRSDFTKIKAGSFLKANGGYLVLNLLDLLIEPGVWPALKRALRTKSMEIQTFDPFYWFTSVGLKPEPIDVDIKVILLSTPDLYALLRYYDEDVPKVFKVRADFDTSMTRDEASILKFASFLKKLGEDEGLLPFDRTGVATLAEHAVRMTGRSEKISTAFPLIADLAREADHYARSSSRTAVSEKDVDAAIHARIRRSNLIEEKIQEMIDRGSILMDTQGSKVGQVNGLSVIDLGEYAFGRPTRITAVTSMGSDGIINIEREAKLGGPIFNKGVLILSGYLRYKYAQDKPLTMNASLAFEQSYSGVEGDSASSTEIYAILSSLADVPLRQDIAVTGSVNQKGEVQAIGGVNEKIEGFYDCCKASGLTGEQGVMIPASNVKDLMLRKDVVEAIEKGQFHLWAVRTIDEGIGILTGVEAGMRGPDGTYPEGTINGLVDRRLGRLAEDLKKFGKEEMEGEEEEEEESEEGNEAS